MSAEQTTPESANNDAAAGALTQLLQENFPDAVKSFHAYRGDETVVIDRNYIAAVCAFLRDNPRSKLEMMMDLTAVDYLNETPRFEVVYHFKSLSLGHRFRLKTRVPEDDCKLDSIHELWDAVNWYERECYDMYGITFTNHPNMTRILMYEGFEGHPLRKDYPIDRHQPILELREIDEERYEYGRG